MGLGARGRVKYHRARHVRAACGGYIVTSLPARLALRPEVVGIGISVANVAMAGGAEELSLALDALRRHAAVFKDALHEIFDQFCDFQEGVDEASGQELREVMFHLQTIDILYSGASLVLAKVINTLRIKCGADVVHQDFFLVGVSDIIEMLNEVHIPIIRRARLSVIMLVFRRAQERGVEGARLDAGFAEWFMAASQAETESWQETAHLLAVPESADRLLRSIGTISRDRTDQIPGPTV